MTQHASRSLTEGSLWKNILLFSIPLMLSNVLQVLFNMSDVAVVGRFAGPAALGSVGSTTTLTALITGLVLGMGSSVNVCTARFLGAKRDDEVEKTVHTSLILCFLSGVLIAVTGVVCARGILSLLHTKEELLDGAVLYFRIYVLGMPAMGVFNFGSGVYAAAGETKRPLYYLLSAGVINVLLNLFFVIVLRMDVAGVALASVISQYLSAFLVLGALLRCRKVYGVRLSRLSLDRKKARMVLALGIPSAMQNAIFQVANLFIQTGVNSFDAVTVEGAAAAQNADGLVYDVMAAVYTACSSFISQNFGAGKRDRILKSYFVSLAYSFGFGLLLGCSLVLFGNGFLSLFTSDAAVMAEGMYRLRVMGLSYGFSAFMDNSIAASRGLGKSVVPTVIVILGSCVFRVIWVYTIFAYFHTITSLYLLYIFSWTITAIAEILYFARCYRWEGRRLAQ